MINTKVASGCGGSGSPTAGRGRICSKRRWRTWASPRHPRPSGDRGTTPTAERLPIPAQAPLSGAIPAVPASSRPAGPRGRVSAAPSPGLDRAQVGSLLGREDELPAGVGRAAPGPVGGPVGAQVVEEGRDVLDPDRDPFLHRFPEVREVGDGPPGSVAVNASPLDGGSAPNAYFLGERGPHPSVEATPLASPAPWSPTPPRHLSAGHEASSCRPGRRGAEARPSGWRANRHLTRKVVGTGRTPLPRAAEVVVPGWGGGHGDGSG